LQIVAKPSAYAATWRIQMRKVIPLLAELLWSLLLITIVLFIIDVYSILREPMSCTGVFNVAVVWASEREDKGV